MKVGVGGRVELGFRGTGKGWGRVQNRGRDRGRGRVKLGFRGTGKGWGRVQNIHRICTCAWPQKMYSIITLLA